MGLPLARISGVAVLGVVMAAGCRRDHSAPKVVPVEGESKILPRVTYANAPAGATRTSRRSVSVRGTTRTYLVVEPTEPDARKHYPLVLVLHGDGGDASGFHEGWPIEKATGKNAILAYLDGDQRTWDLETTVDNRDVAFAEAAVADVARDHDIDRSRVFAAGYSSGGFFANVLACHRPALLRAIASNAGGAPYNQLLRWPNGYPMCPGQKPVAMLALHGEHDFSVTLDSGRFSAEYWAYVNGCNDKEMESTGYKECRLYRGCPAGKAVGFCSVPSLEHWVWSDSAEAIWTFFQRQ